MAQKQKTVKVNYKYLNSNYKPKTVYHHDHTILNDFESILLIQDKSYSGTVCEMISMYVAKHRKLLKK